MSSEVTTLTTAGASLDRSAAFEAPDTTGSAKRPSRSLIGCAEAAPLATYTAAASEHESPRARSRALEMGCREDTVTNTYGEIAKCFRRLPRRHTEHKCLT